MTIWDMIKPEFTPAENWGDHERMCGFLLFALIVIRRETKWPIVIHNAYETKGHSTDSQHYKAKAADWHFKTKVPFREQVIKVMSIIENYQLADSVGLGIYPHWNNKGFHLDSRGSRARWAYDKNGKMTSFDEGLKEIGE